MSSNVKVYATPSTSIMGHKCLDAEKEIASLQAKLSVARKSFKEIVRVYGPLGEAPFALRVATEALKEIGE